MEIMFKLNTGKTVTLKWSANDESEATVDLNNTEVYVFIYLCFL